MPPRPQLTRVKRLENYLNLIISGKLASSYLDSPVISLSGPANLVFGSNSRGIKLRNIIPFP